MFLALVGDLSNQASPRLAKVLDAALAGNSSLSPPVPPADLVVQLGDLSGAYDEVATRLKTDKLLVVPGNHDTEWEKLGIPRNWRHETELVAIIGIDTSADTVAPEAWALLDQPSTAPWTLVAMHKSPVPVVLPDLTESTHIMGEGSLCPDADRLASTIHQKNGSGNWGIACGHYHAWSYQQAKFGPMICEGRGGAAQDLAYTLIGITTDGWVVHSVPVT